MLRLKIKTRLTIRLWIGWWCVLLSDSTTTAQIPVEVFGGHQRTTIDVMFFRFIKGQSNQPSNWLFFHRNRVSVDYRMTSNNYLPALGSTEALSWNHRTLKGLAPVATLQLLQGGLYPKAGIQYARNGKDLTIFTWLVTGITAKADHDLFLLLRYMPELNKSTKLFSQLEMVNTLAKKSDRFHSFTQRIRMGVSKNHWQFGIGLDMQQTGRTMFNQFTNTGVFLRHEF